MKDNQFFMAYLYAGGQASVADDDRLTGFGTAARLDQVKGSVDDETIVSYFSRSGFDLPCSRVVSHAYKVQRAWVGADGAYPDKDLEEQISQATFVQALSQRDHFLHDRRGHGLTSSLEPWPCRSPQSR